MNITLYLTKECNLACEYCFEQHQKGNHLTEEIAFRTVDFLLQSGDKNNGISFFGGEPLLQKERIYQIAAYANRKKQVPHGALRYRLTTNGTLLDEKFLEFAQAEQIRIALSHDGAAHNIMRKFSNGMTSEAIVSEKAKLLLKYQPQATAMCTISPKTVSLFSNSIAMLRNLGFRQIISAIDRRPNANWTEESFQILKEQYEHIAQQYEKVFGTKNAFAYHNFTSKIKNHIQGKACCDMECRLGKRQPIVSADGKIYPCIQFTDISQYCMGSVFNGIDKEKQEQIFKQSQKPVVSCSGCGLQSRCQHHCGCLNFQQTGNMNTVSAEQCMHEQILIPIADQLANRLYRKYPRQFLKTFYEIDYSSLEELL